MEWLKNYSVVSVAGKGVSLQQVTSLIGRAVSKGKTPQIAIATGAASGAQEFLTEKFGFDFVGLIIKLAIYFLVALVFAKFMEAVIFLRGGFIAFANLFGLKIPTAEMLPESLKKLFDGGVGGFKYWDIVKLIAIILVIGEFIRYINIPQKSSPLTIGIFLLIISALAITTLPELAKRLKMTDFNQAMGV